MIATYFIIDDFTLKQFENLSTDKKIEKIEDMLDFDDTYPCCDIDEVWHSLYFTLTHKTDIEDIPLSHFIFGKNSICGDYHISHIKNKYLYDIIQNISSIDFTSFKINTEIFKAHNVYPNTWNKIDVKLLKDELNISFEELKKFYVTALNTKKNILVAII